ncbi:MAG TPA: hypothetical protein VFC09_13715 [Candidatus Dormibacteraeota bacterium]|nr:hypothetical protein [Candidatus Dormibacteraeota bacterium]
MRHHTRALSAAVASRLRRLDSLLRIDHRGRSEWVWAGPVGTLLGSIALVVAVGVRSGVDVALYLPVALVIGLAMAGMSIAYMTPMADQDAPPDDGGDTRSPSGAPVPGGGIAAEAAHRAPAWYRGLDGDTAEEPAPRRRRTAERDPAVRR